MVGFFAFRGKYHSVINTLAQTQVKNATSDLINDAIDRQIELGNIQYDCMSHKVKNSYYLAIYRKSLPAPASIHYGLKLFFSEVC